MPPFFASTHRRASLPAGWLAGWPALLQRGPTMTAWHPMRALTPPATLWATSSQWQPAGQMTRWHPSATLGPSRCTSQPPASTSSAPPRTQTANMSRCLAPQWPRRWWRAPPLYSLPPSPMPPTPKSGGEGVSWGRELFALPFRNPAQGVRPSICLQQPSGPGCHVLPAAAPAAASAAYHC